MAGKQTVILLHGMWMGPWAMSWLAHRLGDEGFETRSLSLHSMSDSPDAHIARLAQAVAEVDTDKVHLLGHSFGGVIALRYLHEAQDKRLCRTLLLGVPALGCQAARQLDRQPWGALLGSSRELWFSPFATAVAANRVVGAIAGDHALGLGPLFTSLDGPSDGVVTVAETQVAGLSDHILLHVSHSAMLVSTDVANQASAFLKMGKFQR